MDQLVNAEFSLGSQPNGLKDFGFGDASAAAFFPIKEVLEGKIEKGNDLRLITMRYFVMQ